MNDSFHMSRVSGDIPLVTDVSPWNRKPDTKPPGVSGLSPLFIVIFVFIELVKFRYHVTFLSVIFGSLIFAHKIDATLAGSLLLAYISFNVLLYGGIYTLNDIRDVDSDRSHPRKRFRPVPSGRISLSSALTFSLVSVAVGLISGFALLGTSVLLIYMTALLFNLFYSFYARNVLYLDIVFNSATHPLRLMLGILLTGRDAPLLHLAAYFCFVFGLSCLRRQVEKDTVGWEARATLRSYSVRTLLGMQAGCLVSILACFWMDGFAARGFYTVVIATYVLLVSSAQLVPGVRSLLSEMWTR